MKRWNIKGEFDSSQDLLTQLLKLRNLSDTSDFLSDKTFEEYTKEFSTEFISQLQKASALILEHIKNGTPIIIHGDYDADGIMSTTILYKALKTHLEYNNVYYFIPDRFKHGYGLSMKSCDAMFEMTSNQPFLLITVDCGITSAKEVDFLKSKGCTVIVTDHHQKPETIPASDALVWNDTLVGASIAFLLTKYLDINDSADIAYATVATITDLQKLIGFNRALVKSGLKVINSNKCPAGLSALLEIAGKKDAQITAYDMGWVVGPRINATGRINTATAALDLFLSANIPAALEHAKNLHSLNADRQVLTEEMFGLADVANEEPLPKILFSHNVQYHEGIIGLVAAKLAQKYYRPAIVISMENEVAKASVRSVPGVNVIEFLRSLDFQFLGLGGHPMAAGFSIEKAKLSELEECIKKASELQISDEVLVPTVYIDMVLPFEEISQEMLNTLSVMEPFGVGNEEPTFASKKVTIGRIDKVGTNKNHLSLDFVSDSGVLRKGILFNLAEDFKDLYLGQKVDIAYKVQSKEYKGKTYIDLVLKDIVAI